MEVVIIPAWRRPDFLKATLMRLVALDGREHVHFLVSIDRGFTPGVWSVVQWFTQAVGRPRVTVKRRRHAYRGNSFNVLSAYQEALALHPEFVHLIEEDIFVGHDYLHTARRVHELAPEAFNVSACRNQQFPLGVEPPNEDDAFYLHSAYQSLAVSWRPEALSRVLSYVNQRYYANPVRYCQHHFPGSRITPGNAEQDGLVHRIMEIEHAMAGYMASPRAYHAGFEGYHRNGAGLSGDIDGRAQRLLTMTTRELNTHAHSYPDHVAVPLDAIRAPITRRIEWAG